MGVPATEDGYTSATAGRRDHEVHKGHVVALKKYINIKIQLMVSNLSSFIYSLWGPWCVVVVKALRY
jgi:hypothetical protein